jgi:hypothetical protein
MNTEYFIHSYLNRINIISIKTEYSLYDTKNSSPKTKQGYAAHCLSQYVDKTLHMRRKSPLWRKHIKKIVEDLIVLCPHKILNITTQPSLSR